MHCFACVHKDHSGIPRTFNEMKINNSFQLFSFADHQITPDIFIEMKDCDLRVLSDKMGVQIRLRRLRDVMKKDMVREKYFLYDI